MRDNDKLIRGGEVVDGTGRDRFRADVRIRAGRIVEVGVDLRRDGEDEIDASGAIVAPGFIDTHAHSDPQVFWDPRLDPEPLHGVTTMLIGNCSLTLFPVSDRTRGEVSDLFAYIEDVPRHLFDESVPWTWTDHAGYRDAVNAVGAGANLAPLVGHTMLRLEAMGPAAWERPANDVERSAMAALLAESMASGAWGLSTSALDVAKDGRPVPSRHADGVEFDVLLDVIARSGRGVLEYVPNLLGADAPEALSDLARRCGRRSIPFTWTGFAYNAGAERWLELTRELAGEGVQSYPQLSPRTVDFRLNWASSMMFMSMPEGWHKVIAADLGEKPRILSDPEWRDTARAEWDRTERSMFPVHSLDKVRVVEVHGADQEPWLGRSLADLVTARGGHPSDVFADFVLANDCRPGIVAVGVANADIDGVGRTLADPSVLISSSDAGAHMQMLCASGDPTLLLTRHVRERCDLGLEQAVHELTGRQAAIFGFAGRGAIAEGAIGDVIVFGLDELHYDDDVFVDDLPGGGSRLRRPEGGYRATLVAGEAVQLHGELTGALPGRVIGSDGS